MYTFFHTVKITYSLGKVWYVVELVIYASEVYLSVPR